MPDSPREMPAALRGAALGAAIGVACKLADAFIASFLWPILGRLPTYPRNPPEFVFETLGFVWAFVFHLGDSAALMGYPMALPDMYQRIAAEMAAFDYGAFACSGALAGALTLRKRRARDERSGKFFRKRFGFPIVFFAVSGPVQLFLGFVVLSLTANRGS